MDDICLDVFEMANLSVDVRDHFQSDLRIIVDYLAEGKDYEPGDRGYKILCREINGKGEVKMCELLEKYRKQGERRGEKKGLERVNKLVKILLQNGRLDDLKRSTEDKAYQRKLFEEFGL